MYYVYIVKSLAVGDVYYVGYTTDLNQRIATHNSGGSVHTAKNRLWQLLMCLAFKEKGKTRNFEHYLKS